MVVKIQRVPLSLRITAARKAKLEAIALKREKDMTEIIHDLIDRAPDPRVEGQRDQD